MQRNFPHFLTYGWLLLHYLGKEIDSCIVAVKKCWLFLTDFRVFITLITKKWFLLCRLSAYLCVCVNAYMHAFAPLLLPEQLNEFCQNSVFSIWSILGQGSVNMILSSPEIHALQKATKTQICFLSKKNMTIFIKFQ